jgi:hypothetical protein
VDTEMTAAIDLPKITPAAVAEATLDALQAGEPEALVDDFGRMFKAGLSDDQATIYPQIEREFLAAVGAGTAATGGDR